MVLGFQYSVSLDEGEVEGEMSTGSISGPDDKPGPVFLVPVVLGKVWMVSWSLVFLR